MDEKEINYIKLIEGGKERYKNLNYALFAGTEEEFLIFGEKFGIWKGHFKDSKDGRVFVHD